MVPTSRFAIAKLRGPAICKTNATTAFIPTNDQLIRPTGAIVVSNAPRKALLSFLLVLHLDRC